MFALGWVAVNTDEDEFEIRPDPGRLPGLLFVPVRQPKVVKNRLHLDFRPQDQRAEVDRLLALGAVRADAGQGESSWVDPVDHQWLVPVSPGRNSDSPAGTRWFEAR